MNALATAAYTPEDLLAMPESKGFELVDGDLVETNVSTLSSWVGGEAFGRLREHVRPNDLGTLWPADCGLQCYAEDPGRVRRPDVMFIGRDRYPLGKLTEGYLREVPDLVVEVVSPNDLATEVDRKVAEYIEAGVRLIWVINPEARIVRVHRGDRSAAWLNEDQELSGEAVVPGFRCLVRDLFPPLPAPSPA